LDIIHGFSFYKNCFRAQRYDLVNCVGEAFKGGTKEITLIMVTYPPLIFALNPLVFNSMTKVSR